MPKSISLEEFVNACEERLRRVEAVINTPEQFQSELQQLEELLRSEWPDAIVNIKEFGITAEEKEKIKIVIKKINKIELEANTRISFFEGIDDVMKEPKIR